VSKYARAGVNLEQSDSVKEKIAQLVSSTFGPNVLSSGGEFGGVYRIPDSNLALIASVDGVGTKLKVAFLTGIHDTIGQDLVNHCVNDIGVMGAKPAFFLDYLATGILEQSVVLEIIKGLVGACNEHSMALVGGETAQMPGMYSDGEYDLAGAIIGFVDSDSIYPQSEIKTKDAIIGFRSNGLHTNGYSLARAIVFEQNNWSVDTHNDELGHLWGEELLRIHLSYAPQFEALSKIKVAKAFAHITGGGIEGNLIRVLPQNMEAFIEAQNIPTDPVFQVLKDAGDVTIEEMFKVFNMGVGMILITSPTNVDGILDVCNNNAFYLGECKACSSISKVTIQY